MDSSLTYQEILRTLGTLLDQAGGDTATLELTTKSAVVEAPSWPGPREWSLDALLLESERQRSWRNHPRPPHMARAGHFNRILRVVGAVLDAQGGGPYTLVVEEQLVRVRAVDGTERLFESKPLERRLKLAAHLRGQL
jgi:hypothetical protein